MGNENLLAKVGNTAVKRAPDSADQVRDLLARMGPDLRTALPATAKLTPERLARIAITTMRVTPSLMQCSVPSLLGAMVQCAQLGLEPDPRLGLAYLVPYGKDCQLIIGYRGLIQLARRSGDVATVEAHVVYEHDHFDCQWGTEAHLTHRPLILGDRGEAVMVYALAKFADGSALWEVMSRADVDAIRARSKTSSNGPWKTDYLEMARKTVVRRLSKYLPLSVEWADAEAADGAVVTDIDKHGPVLTATAYDAPASVDEPAPEVDLPEPFGEGE